MNNSSKAFFVILVFIMFLVVFAGGSIGQTDLTPNTPSSLTGGPSSSNFLPDLASPGIQAGYGYCGPVYTVISGDTMSTIAVKCGVALNALVAANPNIYNANLIKVGQQINMPYVGAAPTLAPTATLVPTAVPPTATPIPYTGGLRPTARLLVKVTQLLPKTTYVLGYGPVNTDPVVAGETRTDDNGVIETYVTIPDIAKTGETWVITVWLKDQPEARISAPPFVIE